VGCNIALNRVPADARIQIVKTVFQGGTDILSVNSKHRPEACATVITPPEEVRAQFKRVKPLENISVTQRGWTLDVLNIVRRLVESRRRGDESLKSTGQPESLRLLTSSPTNEFTTMDVYAFERELAELHPDYRHVRDKIRQQLQVLRDLGLLIHVGRGEWRLP
jgi:type II restriction enzyme